MTIARKWVLAAVVAGALVRGAFGGAAFSAATGNAASTTPATAAPERGAAGRAEVLREPVRRLVGADQLVPGEDPQRPRDDARLRGGRRPRPPLAARAVAVAGRDERLGHLEPNGAAEAPAGE